MGKARLDSIQVLRGVAAALVVFYHAYLAITVEWPASLPHPVIWLPKGLYESGAVGVDIFFVISGFIMVYVSKPYREGHRPADDFFARRLIRIYPMYAFVTLVQLMEPVLAMYRHGNAFPFSSWDVFASFTFIPTFTYVGRLEPILQQGWTLLYEMFFYLCFSITLAVSPRRLLPPLAVAFGGVMLAAWSFGSSGALSTFFGNTIMIEFLFGCAVGLALQNGMINSPGASTWIGLSVASFTAASFVGDTAIHERLRFLLWGVPAAMLLIGFVKLEKTARRWPAWVLLLGDASYSVYLAHVIFIYRLRNALKNHSIEVASGDALLAFLSLGAIGLCLVVYRFAERPMNEYLNDLYRRARPPGKLRTLRSTANIE